MKKYKVRPVEERFWSKVDIGESDDCWNWMASVQNSGYGHFRMNGKLELTHRVSWMLTNGEIPEDLQVLHICITNRRCVNPRHLYIGTQQDNINDMMNQRRNGNVKLTDEEVIEIRKKYKTGEYTQQRLADEYGVHRSNIGRIVNNKTHRIV